MGVKSQSVAIEQINKTLVYLPTQCLPVMLPGEIPKERPRNKEKRITE